MALDPRCRKAADTIRILAAEGVQKANSGHPGMPMGCADYAFTLWFKHLRHNPENPGWLGRDRFVLSAGHGSMLVYSLLHLFGYDVSMEDLKQFRQWESKTPGHPEYGMTPGVEVTTGPLGTGFGSAVGMAMAAKQLAGRMGSDELFNQRIFAISGDGCMMEGCTQEAASFAGHLCLDNLVVFYDDNSITIEGSTDLAFTEDVPGRFRALGWNVLNINGQSMDEADRALTEALANATAPTLVVGKTTIGYGAPSLAGSHDCHGAPLGHDEVAALKKELGFPEEAFHVPAEVRDLCARRTAELKSQAADWDAKVEAYCQANPDKAELLDALVNRRVPEDILEQLLAAVPEKVMATRASGGAILQKAAELVPALTGGAADLNPSTKTQLKAYSDFSVSDRAGRNIHFGVREFAMGLAANGMALYGTAIPFTATFGVFSDFMKPPVRLAALQKLHVAFVYTHDSVFVGEDGPTHQPIEHLLMLRSIPNMTVIRPAESYEVAHAWAAILKQDGPAAIFLTRQNVQNIPEELRGNIDVARGGYVLSDDKDFNVILIATGSEVMLAYEVAQKLRADGCRVRVVSMPSCELFLRQDKAYRDQVLPPDSHKRVTIEAATTIGWERFAGDQGLMIGIDHFGDSAPAEVLVEKYGLTAEAIIARIHSHFCCGPTCA